MAIEKTNAEQEKWRLEAGREDETMEALLLWGGVGVTAALEIHDEGGGQCHDLAPQHDSRERGDGVPGALILALRGPSMAVGMHLRLQEIAPGTVRVDALGQSCWGVMVNDNPAVLLMNKRSTPFPSTGPWPHTVALFPDSYDDFVRLPATARLHIMGGPENPDLDAISRIKSLEGLAFYRSHNLGDFRGLSGATIRGLRLVDCDGEIDLSIVEELPCLEAIQVIRDHQWPISPGRIEPAVIDIRSFARVRYLRTVSLHGVEIEHADRFARMGELGTLDLFRCQFDQDKLHFVTPGRLFKLRLAPCKLTGLAALKNLKRLRSLELLWAEPLESLDGIDELVNLEELTISGNPSLPTLYPLAGLQRLTRLEISASGIYSACGIEKLKRLTHLDLGVPLSFPGELKKLTGLKELKLSNAKLRDLSFLTSEHQLEKLAISCMDELESFRGLETQKNLKELNLFIVDGVSDYSPLLELKQLEKLVLAGCKKLGDLSFLNSMPNIVELSLDNCPDLTSTEPVGQLANLRQLTLRDCPQVSDLSSLSGCRALQECIVELGAGLDHQTDQPPYNGPSLAPLAKCPDLRAVHTAEREVEVVTVLAQCAAKAGDWQFIEAQGGDWLDVMMLSDQPTLIAEALLDAFLGAREHGFNGGHLDGMVKKITGWGQACELVRGRLEELARQKAQFGDSDNHDNDTRRRT